MRVTYLGEQGNVRKVYTNIAMYNMKSVNTVELVHIIKHAQPVPDVIGKEYMRTYDQYGTVAIIHLAPGEYLEWSADAERD